MPDILPEVIRIKPLPAFQDIPLRKKIQIINLFIISVSIVFLTISLYRLNLNQTIDRTISSSQRNIVQITNTVSTLLNGAADYSKLAIISETNQSVLSSENEAPDNAVADLEAFNLMYASLTSMIESNPNIDSVIMQSIYGKIYHSSNLEAVTPQNISIYPKQQLIEAKGSAVWIDTFHTPFLDNERHKNVLSVGRQIISMDKGTPIGFLYVNVDERVLANLYGNDEQGLRSRTMIINNKGTIISANEAVLVNRSIGGQAYADWVSKNSSGSKIFNDGKQNLLVSFQMMDKHGWKLVYTVPVADLMKDQWKITFFIIGFGVAGLLIAGLLSAFLSGLITRPLTQFSRVMSEVGLGRLDTRAPIGARDEIGQLALKFNQMIDRIQELMQTVNREEKQKRMLELRLLYSQIKPHFLYNTLEMIRSMALMVQAREISGVVKALGDYYRLSLSKGKELITAAQEKKHLESYLYIQKMRYKQMEYTVEFDEAILLCWIPTMLLQPIVENAIYHGMREMPEGGACVIRGMLERNGGIETLCFSVRDNGKGMDEEQLKQIWFPSPDRSGPDLSSFGIQNVQERIRLRFGDNYGIKIFSELGKGVEVQVRLPVVLEWEEQEKGSMDQDG